MSTADRFNAERIRRTVGLEEFAQVLEALGASVDRTTRRSSCPVHKGTGRKPSITRSATASSNTGASRVAEARAATSWRSSSALSA